MLARYYGEMCDKVRQTDNKAALAYSCNAIACQYTTKLSAHSAKGPEVTWQVDLRLGIISQAAHGVHSPGPCENILVYCKTCTEAYFQWLAYLRTHIAVGPEASSAHVESK